MPDNDRTNDSLKILLCGGVAGTVAKSIVAPFDRVKIHFQIQNPRLQTYSGKLLGVFRALHIIYHESGLRGLFRGHSAMVIRIFPYAAINFYSYERIRRWLYAGLSADQVHWTKRVLAGSCAGGCAVSVTYPLDIFRARLALDMTPTRSEKLRFGSYKSVFSTLCAEGRKIYGIPFLGFYQGFWPTFFGIIPYAGVSFFSFESMKLLYRKSRQSSLNDSLDIPLSVKLPIGMLAGALAQAAAYPFDLIRRRSQVLSVAPFLQTPTTRRSMVSIATQVFKGNGIRGFFVGLSINYIKVAPATGVSFIVYEFMRDKVFQLDSKK